MTVPFQPTDDMREFQAAFVERLLNPSRPCHVLDVYAALQPDYPTVGGAIGAMASSPQYYLSALVWIGLRALDLLEPKLRLGVVRAIAQTDPAAAAAVLLRAAELLPAERALLRASVMSSDLPVIKRRLLQAEAQHGT